MSINGGSRRLSRQEIGRIGEQEACERLAAASYNIRERNWRCRTGEIDIIAEKEGRIVIVEVRTRKTGGRFGAAAESVDYRKQRQVRETALVYLRMTGQADSAMRFDVITVELNESIEVISFKHIEAAF